MGTAAVASIYAMTHEAFDRRDLAIGAAALAAIHPAIAAYSASVRTEAGYIFLTTSGAALILRGLRTPPTRVNRIGRRDSRACLFVSHGSDWDADRRGDGDRRGSDRLASVRDEVGARGAIMLAGGFLLVASPYLIYLRANVGHWTVGREFNAAMMYGMGDVAQNPQEWRRQGYSSSVSPLASAFAHPQALFAKSGRRPWGVVVWVRAGRSVRF